MNKLPHLIVFVFSLTLGISAQESETIPFAKVEQVPIYPGCENLEENTDLKQCMSNKIATFVSRKFKKRVLSKSNLSAGKKRIFVSFKIDTSGNIIDIQTRGPNKASEQEATRVIRLLPKMVAPGMVDGKPVIVPYSLPILFEVKNKRKRN
ncbi:energy transducer TonB [Winogradskyella sp.]|uniref:energy transducer TonB n=1 Tax=Winogradskyella sp. TaxID=1883156 RepID=UPI003F6D1701